MTAVPQERRIVTAIPGPKSQELQARRLETVAGGVGCGLPRVPARPAGGPHAGELGPPPGADGARTPGATR
ncbi:hypothetical protein ACFXPJ_28660, partial [Streptomyces goshikiensis]